MKIYLVGGAVRDTAMGIVPKDRDYVVVGATPADMVSLGYQQVGADFPVFLHPSSGEEYALARQDRKTGVGYNGFETVFDPSITLEEDLIRRDLTINSMAMDLDTGNIIDPYGGRADINARVLRATSDAFAEDPIRVLRTARFAARYGFSIDSDTVSLMHRIVPEIDHVPAERVFAEFNKGLSEALPYDMITALENCEAGRSKAVAPYLRLWLKRLLLWVNVDTPMSVRFALVASSFTDQEYEDCKIPTEYSRVSKAVHNNFDLLTNLHDCSPADAIGVFDKLRTWSDREFSDCVLAVVGFYVKHGIDYNHDDWKVKVKDRINKAGSIDAASIAAACVNPRVIKTAIFNARVTAIST